MQVPDCRLCSFVQLRSQTNNVLISCFVINNYEVLPPASVGGQIHQWFSAAVVEEQPMAMPQTMNEDVLSLHSSLLLRNLFAEAII